MQTSLMLRFNLISDIANVRCLPINALLVIATIKRQGILGSPKPLINLAIETFLQLRVLELHKLIVLYLEI